MMFHGLIESRIVKTKGIASHRQNRLYCHTHGWYDLFVFPNAEADHGKCNQPGQPAAVGLEIPKTFAKAA